MGKKLVYVIIFFFSKSSVFLAPLFLTEFMSMSDYGKIEYSLGGLGFIINTIIGLGIPATYAYFILKKNDLKAKMGYSLYILFLVVYFVLTQLMYFVVPKHIYLSLIISFILANQVFYSYVFKAQGQAIYATMMDSGIYLVFLIIIMINYVLGTPVEINDFFAPLLSYSGVFAIIGIYKNRNIDLHKAIIQLKKITKYSWHLLIGSFLIILLLNSGRFLMDFFKVNFEEIGIFGYYLRISGISLVIFQMLFILYFKEIYTKSIQTLDKIFALFLGIVLMYSLVSLYILPVILKQISSFFDETFADNMKLFFLLTFFTFYWTGYNLFSNIIVREKLAKNYNFYLIGILILFSLGLLSISGMDIETFAIIQLIIGIIVVVTQQVLLYAKGIIFKNTINVLLISILFALTLFIYY